MSGSEPLVSIVIPAYNCGGMFDKCIASIRTQSLEDFEVIIINNGSTDGTAETARRAAREDKRFRVTDMPHGMAGSARNAGISAARGEYIAFVDGDDCIAPQYLERLYRAARDNGADISVCGFDYYFLNREKLRRGLSARETLYTRDEALGLLLQDTKIKFYLWGKLFRRSLFEEHDITIPDMYYEDAAAVPRLFWFANKVASTDYCGYHYTRAFSKYTEVRMTPGRVNDYINTVPMIRLFLEEQGAYDKFKGKLRIHVFHVYYAVPSMVKQSAQENKRPAKENISMARAKLRLCLKLPYERLKGLDLEKPVVE